MGGREERTPIGSSRKKLGEDIQLSDEELTEILEYLATF